MSAKTGSVSCCPAVRRQRCPSERRRAVSSRSHPRKLTKLAADSAASSSAPSDTSPLSAAAYFDTALEIAPGFRAYYTAPRDPRGTVFVCVHGAGYSGLSFACLADELRTRSHGKVGCLAFDARGHGLSRLVDIRLISSGKTALEESTSEFSLDRLSDDLVTLLRQAFPDRATGPALILVGHSMVDHCARAH